MQDVKKYRQYIQTLVLDEILYKGCREMWQGRWAGGKWLLKKIYVVSYGISSRKKK